MLGRTVSPYRILEKLGGGGMGVACKAQGTRRGAEVYLGCGADPASRRNCPRSFGGGALPARSMRCFRSPSPEHLHHHDIGEQDGQPFIAMELLEGQTLKDRLWL